MPPPQEVRREVAAFDVTCSHDPSGSWTAMHRMTLNGKRDGFALANFEACAKAALMKRGTGRMPV